MPPRFRRADLDQYRARQEAQGKEDLSGDAVRTRRRIAVGGILVHTN